jgi:hypothetical protein
VLLSNIGTAHISLLKHGKLVRCHSIFLRVRNTTTTTELSPSNVMEMYCRLAAFMQIVLLFSMYVSHVPFKLSFSITKTWIPAELNFIGHFERHQNVKIVFHGHVQLLVWSRVASLI